ncbi:MAG: electron transfer flavoprotein subunit alpha/FixB family protein, partial [Eudoraea sp.]|nr:electron transfer flavoprotein subunit alpha/FixB family protein [Eudoraea sp.]
MSVLVYTESENGKFKKSAFEAASYAHKVAQEMGTTVTAVSFNIEDNSSLATYGVSKVLKIND